MAEYDAAEKRPAAEWASQYGITVADPDGWDRANFAQSWAEPITATEFARRASLSTCSGDFGPLHEFLRPAREEKP